jgi:Tfp pilus assembly protein PilN
MKAINLLPPDLRKAPKSGPAPVAADEPGGSGAFVVLGALAVCVVALAAYVLTSNTVKDRTAQLEATEAQAAETTQRVAQLKPYADFKALAETRIQTVRDLAGSRFDWEQALRDISRAIPSNVTLESLNGSISSQSGGGSTIRGAIMAPAIELKGCTSGQLSLAGLMSRLRNVDGVTRVSLSKSLKADKQAASAATAGPIGTTTGEHPPCGNPRAPQFELVIFFERSAVPQSVQDITVQASAQQTSTDGAGAEPATPDGTTDASGATTPPADPGAPTATPTVTPQGAGTP